MEKMASSTPIVSARLVRMEEIQEKVLAIAEKFNPDKIILFGSYASGAATPDSDVDLLVIIDTDQPTRDLSVTISLLFKHSFPMDIIVRTPGEIARRLAEGDFFLRDIIEKGEVLYERAG